MDNNFDPNNNPYTNGNSLKTDEQNPYMPNQNQAPQNRILRIRTDSHRTRILRIHTDSL